MYVYRKVVNKFYLLRISGIIDLQHDSNNSTCLSYFCRKGKAEERKNTIISLYVIIIAAVFLALTVAVVVFAVKVGCSKRFVHDSYFRTM